jgi:3-hydroxyisobutyrate dehydrogenase-like beta-hydroxyacid dehydrogenase
MLENTKIGYIGLGNMGAPMAQNLFDSGCDITVYDLDEEKLTHFKNLGVKISTSAAELASQVDILFTSLPQPKHVAAALPELLGIMKQGSVWVDLTTNDKEVLTDMATLAVANGINVVEAPVTGAVDGARLRKLTFFVGGEPANVARVTPYFDLLGKPIMCGQLGKGNVVKLITNQIWFINACAIGEALSLGQNNDIDLLTLWEALKNSVGDTFVARHDVPSIFAGHYDPSFSLALCCKDLRLLDQLGSQTKTQMDLTSLTREKFEQAREEFGDDAAELLVCKRVENASNTNLKIDGDWVNHWEV